MRRILPFLLMFFTISSTIIFGQYDIVEIEGEIFLYHINNNLEAVGIGGTFPNYNFYYWNNGNATILFVPPQPFQTFELNAINDNGFIVGNIDFDEDTLSSLFFKWDRTGNLNYMDDNIYRSSANDINNNNVTTGFRQQCGDDNCPNNAVTWSPTNAPINISNISGFAEGINNLNHVVGISFTANGSYPFYWDAGTVTILPEPPGANGTYASKINDNNYIIGRSQIGGNSIPVYWINQQLIVPLMPAGLEHSIFIDINSHNQILGDAGLPFGPFIYEEGDVKLLKDLIPQNSGWEVQTVRDINDRGIILASGEKNGVYKQMFLVPSFVKNPSAYDKWIAGEKDTIKWAENNWSSVNIICIANFETPIESEIILAEGAPVVSPEFEWEIPDTLLSFRSKIIVENANDTSSKIESEIFRIKPFVLTRVNDDSTYYAYKKDRDQWGFSNTQEDMWPSTWFNQFDYKGLDPFTNINYPQFVLDSLFFKAKRSNHPDWISWVRTFSEIACYANVAEGIYFANALLKWKAIKDVWGGSCFGIAVANALAFSYREQFQVKYPEFPDVLNPINVTSEPGVKRDINELFTYQFGNPHVTYRANIGLNKTPKQTLMDLMEMLTEDDAKIRTLSFNNNGPGGGGHAILAYGLKKDLTNPSLFYVKVYDNSNPTSINPILIDTSANGNNGSWTNPDWPGWGGSKWFYLRNPTIEYFNTPIMAKRGFKQSPFVLDEDEFQVFNTTSAAIELKDEFGNSSGFYNNMIQLNVPGSVPFIADNGSETPPYGYSLPTDNYSVVLSDFTTDTVETFFFTGNKSFSYERYGTSQAQTDRLFFDGGVSAVNPDAETKTIRLLNLVNETTQEKLCVIRAIELAQNDSIKIENPDSNKVKIISYGSVKDYDIELNYVTANGIGRFGDFNIFLSANTSHTFSPNWTDITNTELKVLVDIGNDGTIDDTLRLLNQVTWMGNDQGSLLKPNNFILSQNYPNPFNPTTKINFSIPVAALTTLKVFDVLGNEVAILVNEEKPAGSFEVEFVAQQLSSGVYFYKLQSNNLIEMKKMILLR